MLLDFVDFDRFKNTILEWKKCDDEGYSTCATIEEEKTDYAEDL